MPTTDRNARDVARFRRRAKDAGLKRIEVMVPAGDADLIRAFADRLRRRHARTHDAAPPTTP